jgi:hypothetical protein
MPTKSSSNKRQAGVLGFHNKGSHAFRLEVLGSLKLGGVTGSNVRRRMKGFILGTRGTSTQIDDHLTEKMRA